MNAHARAALDETLPLSRRRYRLNLAIGDAAVTRCGLCGSWQTALAPCSTPHGTVQRW